MNRLLYLSLLIAIAVFAENPPDTPASSPRSYWVTGYYYSPPAWGGLPVANIDFSVLTHVVHFPLVPAGNGAFEANSLRFINDYASQLIRTAHDNGVKVLLGVAQSKGGGDFETATRSDVLPVFVDNILELVRTYGYDGVDLDWEHNVNPVQFKTLVAALRIRLDALKRRGILTGAFWESTNLGGIVGAFDQINIMSYDGCSLQDGFSWHNAALYNAGDHLRRTVDWGLSQFASPPASIPAAKLGLGIPFYGYIWRGGAGTSTVGVTAPGQTWTSPPSVRSAQYSEIVTNASLWRDTYRRRDVDAGNVPYLSINLPSADTYAFVTYDDETSIAAKVAFAKLRGIGGLMVYELSGDYLPGRTPQHPLMQALRTAAASILGLPPLRRGEEVPCDQSAAGCWSGGRRR